MEPQTLVLSPQMQPHRIASWQEAIVLVYTDKCDVLEEYDATVSSPTVTLQVPAVVRLRKEMSLFKKGVKYSPANIMQRDRYVCCYCGKRKKPRELNCDHVVPRVQGGRTVWLNIVASCYPCNRKKGARTPQRPEAAAARAAPARQGGAGPLAALPRRARGSAVARELRRTWRVPLNGWQLASKPRARR
jgi:5-methylcytosine-specific restriction endonuclease McrA